MRPAGLESGRSLYLSIELSTIISRMTTIVELYCFPMSKCSSQIHRVEDDSEVDLDYPKIRG